MPRGDRTGPMTGRGAGFCAGYEVPCFTNNVWGRGFGTGLGRGRGFFGCGGGRVRGWRNKFFATGLPGWTQFGATQADPEIEKKALHCQAEALQVQLELIKKRLFKIETKTATE